MSIDKANKSGNSFGLIFLGAFLLIAFSVGIIFWDTQRKNQDKRPDSQIVFETKLTSLKKEASYNNNNDISREIADKELQEFISSSNTASQWKGVVVSVENTVFNGSGIKVHSLMPPKRHLDYTSYYLKEPTGVNLAALKIGSEILFSGYIGGSNILTLDGFVSSILNNDIIQLDNPSVNIIED